MSGKNQTRYRSEISVRTEEAPMGNQLKEQRKGPHRAPSMGSDGASLENSPESRNDVTEEQDSFDEEGSDDILARIPACNRCGHKFSHKEDFVSHVKMHFEGGNSKENSGKKRGPDKSWEERESKTVRVSPPSDQNQTSMGDEVVNFAARFTEEESLEPERYSPNSSTTGYLGNSFPGFLTHGTPQHLQTAGQRTSQTPQNSQQAKASTQTYQKSPRTPQISPLSNYPQINRLSPQISGHLPHTVPQLSPPAVDAQPGFLDFLNHHQMVQHQQQLQAQSLHSLPPSYPAFLPHMSRYQPHFPPTPSLASPLHPFLPTPAQASFPCMWCGALLDTRESLLYHLQFHQIPGQAMVSNQYSQQPQPQEQIRRQPTQSPPSKCGSNCSCSSCSQGRGKKTKKVVEDIDPDTLRKIQSLEWEKKHGYWCTKCKKRFPSQAKLVDHMSYSEEHNYKEKDPRSPSSSSTPSPRMCDTSPSPQPQPHSQPSPQTM